MTYLQAQYGQPHALESRLWQAEWSNKYSVHCFCVGSAVISSWVCWWSVCCLQVLQHYKDKVAHIVADKSADEVASQIQQAVQQWPLDRAADGRSLSTHATAQAVYMTAQPIANSIRSCKVCSMCLLLRPYIFTQAACDWTHPYWQQHVMPMLWATSPFTWSPLSLLSVIAISDFAVV